MTNAIEIRGDFNRNGGMRLPFKKTFEAAVSCAQ